MLAYPLVRVLGGNPWLHNAAYLSDPQGTAEPDYDKAGPASIVKLGDDDFRCWYEGVTPVKTLDPTNQTGTFDYDTTICYATSLDGLSWTKRQSGSNTEVVVSVGITSTNPGGGSLTWMRGESSVGTVIWDKEDNTFKLWGHGGNNTGPRAIFYATSNNGLSWTFQNSGQPVLEKSSTSTDWDGSWVADARVVKIGVGNYVMLYRGQSATSTPQLGLATSTDGITWTKGAANPVVARGSAGTWDDSVIYGGGLTYDVNGRLHLWYSGSSVGDDGGEALGYAYSNDFGKTWVKWVGNPVLTRSVSGLDSVSMGDTVGAFVHGRRTYVHWGSERSDLSPAFRGRLMAVVDLLPPSIQNRMTIAGRGAG